MNFCTYFDVNYSNKGWVCHHTLYEYLKDDLNFFVLCLDDIVYKQAISKKDKGVIPIKLSEIEKYYSKLLIAKKNREPKEYFATISPILPLYIFDIYKKDLVFYTDADIAFWSDPREMINILGEKSLMVVDHGIEPPRSNVRFNVGILAYKNDKNCRDFLYWWADKCMEWCEWKTMPDGRCADQGYLNIIHDDPKKFQNTLECPHPGVNMGPWNIGQHTITKNGNKILVDGVYNLICYHYHEFRLIDEKNYFPTGWKHTISDKSIVYDPYFKLIIKNKQGLL